MNNNQPPPEKQEPECKYCYDKHFYSVLQGGNIVRGDYPGDKDYYIKPEILKIPCPRCQPKQDKQEAAHACADGTCSLKVPVLPHQDEGMDEWKPIEKIEFKTIEDRKKCMAWIEELLAKDRQQLRERIEEKAFKVDFIKSKLVKLSDFLAILKGEGK